MAALMGARRHTLIAAAITLVSAGALLLARGQFAHRAAFSYLTAFAFAQSIAAGALLFLMLGYAANATWMSVVRRVSELVALALWPLALLFLPIVLWASALYPWAEPLGTLSPEARRAVEHHPIYLSVPSFALRSLLYFAVWIVPATLLHTWSQRRPAAHGADPLAALGRERAISSALLFPAVSALTFAAFDWLMSLQPAWISGALGLYYLVGGALAAVACVTLIAHFGARWGVLVEVLTGHHFHALGRVLFALTILWAYIGYFQVFLILLTDEPAEVRFFVARGAGSWSAIGPALAVGHFGVPVLLLAPRRWKFNSAFLAAVSAWLLVMHYADLYYLIMPSHSPTSAAPHWLDAAALLAVCGGAVLACALRLRGAGLLAAHDPLLAQGLCYRSDT